MLFSLIAPASHDSGVVESHCRSAAMTSAAAAKRLFAATATGNSNKLLLCTDLACGWDYIVLQSKQQQRQPPTMAPPTNSNESYCTFTLASDVTAGGLPSEDEIAKDLESADDNVS